MKRLEAALDVWRAAERKVQEGNGNLTPEMEQELAEAKSRYQELATAHTTERIDALQAADRQRAKAVPSSDPSHDAAADEKGIAAEIWSEADRIDQDARRAAAG